MPLMSHDDVCCKRGFLSTTFISELIGMLQGPSSSDNYPMKSPDDHEIRNDNSCNPTSIKYSHEVKEEQGQRT
jgi:hypothetical protein